MTKLKRENQMVPGKEARPYPGSFPQGEIAAKTFVHWFHEQGKGSAGHRPGEFQAANHQAETVLGDQVHGERDVVAASVASLRSCGLNKAVSVFLLLASFVSLAGAQITNSSMDTKDVFICTGSTNYDGGADLTGVNFGAAGTLAIAPASAAKGEFQSVIMFNLAAGVAQFNAAYGSNNWQITGVTLDLASNYGVAGVQPNNPIFNAISGGQFVIEWLSDPDWAEGSGTPNLPTTDGVCYDSLPELLAPPHEVLCTNTYMPPGNNIRALWPLPVTSNLAANIASSGNVTFRLYAADNQVGYLFNSYKYGRGNEPYIEVVATPILTILSGIFTNGGFELTGIGNNNGLYKVQASTNLATTNWQTIGMANADGNGKILFDEVCAPNAMCFYRLSQ